MTDRSAYPARTRPLYDADDGGVPDGIGPAERLVMVWQLTLQAWSFKDSSPENARRVWSAFETFGAPLDRVELEDLTTEDLVFQIGVVPNRIDILTSITGVEFDEAWPDRVVVEVSGVEAPVIGRDHLIRNKRAVGRPRDLADLAELEG